MNSKSEKLDKGDAEDAASGRQDESGEQRHSSHPGDRAFRTRVAKPVPVAARPRTRMGDANGARGAHDASRRAAPRLLLRKFRIQRSSCKGPRAQPGSARGPSTPGRERALSPGRTTRRQHDLESVPSDPPGLRFTYVTELSWEIQNYQWKVPKMGRHVCGTLYVTQNTYDQLL